jgi:hypothetical protein
VSKNAVRHGLLSIEGLLFGENEAEFALSRMRLESELAPVTEIEQIMADDIVWLAWKLRRARRMEAALQKWKCHEGLAQPAAYDKPRSNFIIPGPAADNSAYDKHRSNLISAATQMQAASTGTDPEDLPDDMLQQAVDLADLQFLEGLSASAWAASMGKIERYESKIAGRLRRQIMELKALQAARRASEETTTRSPVLPQAA